MDKILQGDLGDESAGDKDEKGDGEGHGVEYVEAIDVGKEPPPPEFIMDLPNISSIDLCVSVLFSENHANDGDYRDIMKLTALFTARRGRSFLASLSAREGRNYQFDFLSPTHSLFGYFNRLVEQYTKVFHPNKEMLEQLKNRTQGGARWTTLGVARNHAKWERNKREKDKRRQDDQEAERSRSHLPSKLV